MLSLLGAALMTLLLQLAGGAMGPVGMLLSLLTPLPVAWAALCQGLAVGCGGVALAAGGIALTAGPVAAVGYLLQFGFASVILPALLRRGWSWDRAVAWTLAAVLGVGLLALGGYMAHRGGPVAQTVHQYAQQEIRQAFEVYRTAEIPEAEQAEFAALAERTADLLTRIYPGLAVTVTGAVLLLTVVMLAALARGRFVIPGEPFHCWKAPEQLIWLLIAGGFGALFAEGWPQLAALNLLTVLLPLYFMQGLAVVSYFFRQRGFSPLLRAIGYLLLLAVSPLQLIVAGMGVFDLWADFRKPRIKET